MSQSRSDIEFFRDQIAVDYFRGRLSEHDRTAFELRWGHLIGLLVREEAGDVEAMEELNDRRQASPLVGVALAKLGGAWDDARALDAEEERLLR